MNVPSAVARTSPVSASSTCPAVRWARRFPSTTQPSARIARPTGIGRRKATLRRAVTPHVPRPITDQAITSSSSVHTMPPCATASQPWNRGSSVVSTHEPFGSVWIARCRPCSFSSPHAKQRCGSNSKAPSRSRRAGPTRSAPRLGLASVSDVKVADLARLGLDELLAWLDLLAHELGEDLVGLDRVVRVDVRPQQNARFRVHRRFPELVGVHLAEALEPLHRQVLDVELLDDPVSVLL